jgi:hypothetical protein
MMKAGKMGVEFCYKVSHPDMLLFFSTFTWGCFEFAKSALNQDGFAEPNEDSCVDPSVGYLVGSEEFMRISGEWTTPELQYHRDLSAHAAHHREAVYLKHIRSTLMRDVDARVKAIGGVGDECRRHGTYMFSEAMAQRPQRLEPEAVIRLMRHVIRLCLTVLSANPRGLSEPQLCDAMAASLSGQSGRLETVSQGLAAFGWPPDALHKLLSHSLLQASVRTEPSTPFDGEQRSSGGNGGNGFRREWREDVYSMIKSPHTAALMLDPELEELEHVPSPCEDTGCAYCRVRAIAQAAAMQRQSKELGGGYACSHCAQIFNDKSQCKEHMRCDHAAERADFQRRWCGSMLDKFIQDDTQDDTPPGSLLGCSDATATHYRCPRCDLCWQKFSDCLKHLRDAHSMVSVGSHLLFAKPTCGDRSQAVPRAWLWARESLAVGQPGWPTKSELSALSKPAKQAAKKQASVMQRELARGTPSLVELAGLRQHQCLEFCSRRHADAASPAPPFELFVAPPAVAAHAAQDVAVGEKGHLAVDLRGKREATAEAVYPDLLHWNWTSGPTGANEVAADATDNGCMSALPNHAPKPVKFTVGTRVWCNHRGPITDHLGRDVIGPDAEIRAGIVNVVAVQAGKDIPRLQPQIQKLPERERWAAREAFHFVYSVKLARPPIIQKRKGNHIWSGLPASHLTLRAEAADGASEPSGAVVGSKRRWEEAQAEAEAEEEREGGAVAGSKRRRKGEVAGQLQQQGEERGDDSEHDRLMRECAMFIEAQATPTAAAPATVVPATEVAGSAAERDDLVACVLQEHSEGSDVLNILGSLIWARAEAAAGVVLPTDVDGAAFAVEEKYEKDEKDERDLSLSREGCKKKTADTKEYEELKADGTSKKQLSTKQICRKNGPYKEDKDCQICKSHLPSMSCNSSNL